MLEWKILLFCVHKCTDYEHFLFVFSVKILKIWTINQIGNCFNTYHPYYVYLMQFCYKAFIKIKLIVNIYDSKNICYIFMTNKIK